MSTTASFERCQHRTQFDEQWLRDVGTPDLAGHRNTGRQLIVHNQQTIAAIVGQRDQAAAILIYADGKLVAEHHVTSSPSGVSLLANAKGELELWFAVAARIYRVPAMSPSSVTQSEVEGELQVAAIMGDQIALLFRRDDRLLLGLVGTERYDEHTLTDSTGDADLDIDGNDIHVVYEYEQGLEYRHYRLDADRQPRLQHSSRAAHAYANCPTVLATKNEVLIAYLGDDVRMPSSRNWCHARNRLGRGQVVVLLVGDGETWQRHRVADTEQVIKPLRQRRGIYGGGPAVKLRIRMEEFTPPALGVGSDGVAALYWGNSERRWIYGSRYLEGSVSPACELRGPIEQLAGPSLLPKRVPTGARQPIGFLSQSRVHLDEIWLSSPTVDGEKHIDFCQLDDLAQCHGLEQIVEPMARHPENPVLAIGKRGERDDGGIVADITYDEDSRRWEAEYHFLKYDPSTLETRTRHWQQEGFAISDDGIHWDKQEPRPLTERFSVDGESDGHLYAIRYVEDGKEPNPEFRFKGFWRTSEVHPWGWAPVHSSDARSWHRVKTDTVIGADDDLRIWEDLEDVPERRFKASAISRSFCGRVCAMWTSSDGLHWDGERDTLDFDDPFGPTRAFPSTGRILLDSWSGPPEEDEIHGGYVFRDGARWLLHYMKWTPDGHIWTGLASSRDGLNFSRVGGGQAVLPLGEPGTWDSGRVALREAPIRVGNVWRQYYTGCGWKHGFGGSGALTSFMGYNCPNQIGLAEKPAGRWAGLCLQREFDEATLQTVSLNCSTSARLALNIDGRERAHSDIAVAVVDTHSGKALAGYNYGDMDELVGDGQAVPVSWHGKSLPAGDYRIALRLKGHGLVLYGMHIQPTEDGQ